MASVRPPQQVTDAFKNLPARRTPHRELARTTTSTTSCRGPWMAPATPATCGRSEPSAIRSSSTPRSSGGSNTMTASSHGRAAPCAPARSPSPPPSRRSSPTATTPTRSSRSPLTLGPDAQRLRWGGLALKPWRVRPCLLPRRIAVSLSPRGGRLRHVDTSWQRSPSNVRDGPSVRGWWRLRALRVWRRYGGDRAIEDPVFQRLRGLACIPCRGCRGACGGRQCLETGVRRSRAGRGSPDAGVGR